MNESFWRKLKRGCRTGLFLAPLSLFVLTGSVSASGDDSEPSMVVVTDIIVNRRNIFEAQSNTPSQPSTQLIAQSVNRFHKTTRESVILRELGISAGDSVSVAQVAEAERRLRDLGIFASVSAQLVTGKDGIELHVNTRDNFSIVAGASGSYLGGIGNVGFTTGDKNVLGTGNKLLFNISRATTGDYRGSVSFNDLHFFDKPYRADYSIGRTNEGDFYSFKLRDPFKGSNDGTAWSMAMESRENYVKYYRDGDIVIQIPRDRMQLSTSHVWRRGTIERSVRRGVVASLSQTDYSQASGVLADDIVVPADNREFYVGGLLALDQVQSFKKVQGLDTLNFIQDLRIGSLAEVQLGAKYTRDHQTAESNHRTDPVLSLALSKSSVAGDNAYFKVFFNGGATFEQSGERPWTATTGFRAYNTRLTNTTLALNADYTSGEDGSTLPTQVTLGENNGLRGYDSRQFEGRHRLRLNMEARYHPGWSLGIMDIGLVGFADAGRVVSGGVSAATKRSVGAGLRLASNALLGSGVIRIDLAMPLDKAEGERPDPSLSLAVGQVFLF